MQQKTHPVSWHEARCNNVSGCLISPSGVDQVTFIPVQIGIIASFEMLMPMPNTGDNLFETLPRFLVGHNHRLDSDDHPDGDRFLVKIKGALREAFDQGHRPRAFFQPSTE